MPTAGRGSIECGAKSSKPRRPARPGFSPARPSKSAIAITSGGPASTTWPFVFLDGSYDTIFKRMSARTDHFMKEGMLKSQFEALEPPDKDEAIVVSIDRPPDEIVDEIVRRMS